MTVVILVLLTIAGISFSAFNNIGQWRQAKDASLILRDIETAQREFLANNPQTAVSNITRAQIENFLPNSAAGLPVVNDLNGSPLTIDFNVSPPVYRTGSGGPVYHGTDDGTGDPNDGLWDTGL